MAIDKKGDTPTDEKPEGTTMRVKDSEKVCGIPNEIIPLVNTKPMENFDKSRSSLMEEVHMISSIHRILRS